MPVLSPSVHVGQTAEFAYTVGARDFMTTPQEGQPPVFGTRLDEATFTEARSKLSVLCNDILPWDPVSERILIGTRQQEPHAGDWVIGGRTYAGEPLTESLATKIHDELGITIDAAKLRPIGGYRLVWGTRTQPPLPIKDSQGHFIGMADGVDDYSLLNLYPMSKDEIEQLAHNKEYAGLRWVPPQEILEASEGTYHPALVTMVSDALDVMTTPDAPQTTDEQRLRLHGRIAVAQAALRRLDQK